MNTNPILNFRYFQGEIAESKRKKIDNEFKTNSLQNQATMITKTRESIDSSEISMTYETMQNTFHFERK